MQDIFLKLKEYVENATRSRLMDIGRITLEHVYGMWGGKSSMEDIENGLLEIHRRVMVKGL